MLKKKIKNAFDQASSREQNLLNRNFFLNFFLQKIKETILKISSPKRNTVCYFFCSEFFSVLKTNMCCFYQMFLFKCCERANIILNMEIWKGTFIVHPKGKILWNFVLLLNYQFDNRRRENKKWFLMSHNYRQGPDGS